MARTAAGEPDFAVARELERDLRAGVPRPDDKNGTIRNRYSATSSLSGRWDAGAGKGIPGSPL
jgi:hypothetical protein